jgi:site-specific DNA-methyltransferase (adenine-specific)
VTSHSPTANGSAGHAKAALSPFWTARKKPEARVYVGDCRDILPRIPEVKAGTLDLVFADPPFNWNRAYDEWHDAMPREDYLKFTQDWLGLCAKGLRDGGAFWVNIPDDTAAEIVVYLKEIGLEMVNWCIWHYRFGQNTTGRFINSKVHALYFVKPESERGKRTWNADPILEVSDRRAIYFDPRTEEKKDGMPPGLRLPMDVWYGKYWGRIQGNNKERRPQHDNQLPEVYLARVIQACSNKGDLVLDPFLGSGTTGVVAHKLGRRFIGSEFSEANAARACERIEKGPVRSLHPERHSTAIHAPRKRRVKKT